MKRLIKNGTIVNNGERFVGDILIENDKIAAVGKVGQLSAIVVDEVIDAIGCIVMPGVIDCHVHFRSPGLTHKADFNSESCAAVAGGVTSVMDMPNVIPPTTTNKLLDERFAMAATESVVNYSFYIGATNDNLQEILQIDPSRICGVKVFMGSSTGNMLVDKQTILEQLFKESPCLIATHCESEAILKENLKHFTDLYGDGLLPRHHPKIRSEEVCYASTAEAVELASKFGTRLHVLHLSTAKELSLFEKKPRLEKRITAETCINYLYFNYNDYDTYGYKIKCNPAVKYIYDQEKLISAVENGLIDCISTDHAPHLRSEKFNDTYTKCASGVPMIQHSLLAMLELCRRGIFCYETIVDKMCHAPADLYQIANRGYITEGYKADIVIVNPNRPTIVNDSTILYKCGWSPFEGQEFSSSITHTFVNGHLVYNNGVIDKSIKGEELRFCR